MAGPAPLLRNIQVLIVEDHLDSMELLLFVLEAQEAVIVTAASMKEAQEKLESLRPDVILCDLSLPDASGYTLMQAWRTREIELAIPTIPAIALSGSIREPDQQQGLEAGFQVCLSKPVDVIELPKVIAALVRQRPAPQLSTSAEQEPVSVEA